MLGLLFILGFGFAASALFDHSESDSDNSSSHDEGESSGGGHTLIGQEGVDEVEISPNPLFDHDHTSDGLDSVEPGAGTSVNDSTGADLFGGSHNDTLVGSADDDLINGNDGNDVLKGQSGDDHLIAFDDGQDTVLGGFGSDSLHGFTVQDEPGHLSFIIEDHQSDVLKGGTGGDTLFLGGDDQGYGGRGADEFHVSWDVEIGHPAEITDFNPSTDRIYVDYSYNHSDANLSEIRDSEFHITTAPMHDGTGTSIFINGQAIAHVIGVSNLQASEIGTNLP